MCRHPLFPLTEDDTDEDEVEPVSSAADNEEYIEFRRVEMARTARISENVRTYCVALHLNGSVIRRAQFIGDIATRMFSLTGRSETSVAAASVYLASHLCRQPKRLRDIAELVGSTEGAIQATYRRLYAYYRSSTSYGREIFGYPLDHAAAEDGQSSSVSFIASFYPCAFIASFWVAKSACGIERRVALYQHTLSLKTTPRKKMLT